MTLSIPDWAASDWGKAFQLAVVVFLGMMVAGLVLLLVAILVLTLRTGFDSISWSNLIVVVPSLPLVYLGAADHAPVLLTGVALLSLLVSMGLRWMPGLRVNPSERLRLALLAAKTGVVFAGLMLGVAITLDVLNIIPSLGPSIGSAGLSSGEVFSYVKIVFVSLPLVGAITLFPLARMSGTSIVGLLGLRMSGVPAVVSSSWTGLKRTLRIGLPAVLALWTIGTSLEIASTDFGEAGALAATLLTIVILGAVFAAVDVAALFFMESMSFLQANLIFPRPPGWAWVGVPVLAIAFALGGYKAAEHANPRSGLEAVRAASLMGVLLGVLGVLVSIAYAGAAGRSIVPFAVLLPVLWTLPAIGGAALYANQRGLPSGVAVQRADSRAARPGTTVVANSTSAEASGREGASPTPHPVAPREAATIERRFCTECGAPNPSVNEFCEKCGRPLA